MATGLIDIIKRSALEAVESTKPSDLRYGTVISVSPLKVRISNQFVLPVSMLIVPESLTDHDVEVSTIFTTKDKAGGIEDESFASHNHDVQLTKHTVTIHNALKVGDKVVLIRQAGGQQFLILDRLVGGK